MQSLDPMSAVIHFTCPACGKLIKRRKGDATPIRCENPRCMEDYHSARNSYTIVPTSTPRQAPALVYYLWFNQLVKIGTTTDLRGRLASIPHDRVLAFEPGGYDREMERHKQFADARVIGKREWFHPAPKLMQLIKSLATDDPKADAIAWQTAGLFAEMRAAGQLVSGDPTREGWVDVPAAAEVIGKSTDTVYRWARNGDVPSLLYRGRLVVELSAVLAREARHA